MTSDEQLQQWVLGNPKCPNDNGECCPDFSCCQPSLLAPEPVRKAFAAANEGQRMKLLGSFLGAAMGKMEANAHIAGRTTQD